MSEPSTIHYLKHKEIDRSKWDRCIDTAENGLIYANSFYLDAMARNWNALVLNDYDAVMPLTWNKKYGIHYLYQPFLTAQLGVFGKSLNAHLFENFLNAVPKKFLFWDIYFNHGNIFTVQDYKFYERSNYVLDLNKSYGELFRSYRENIQRNIKKAEQAGCKVQKDFDAEKVIALALQQMKGYAKKSGDNVIRFRKLYQYLHKQKKSITYGITSSQNELLASCVFFFSHNRAYYILVGNHTDGKTIGASHAVIDAFIKDHAGRKLVLDFEGSDIPGLAFFYSSFGAEEEKYSAIRLNRLPFYLKWMKK
ncbi:MAG TPA: hypothetical protein VET23_11745 [Chitinophagaceae bacterium]|nr:hypothetical protein [Chitinophagaceae bacterium]